MLLLLELLLITPNCRCRYGSRSDERRCVQEKARMLLLLLVLSAIVCVIPSRKPMA